MIKASMFYRGACLILIEVYFRRTYRFSLGSNVYQATYAIYPVYRSANISVAYR